MRRLALAALALAPWPLAFGACGGRITPDDVVEAEPEAGAFSQVQPGPPVDDASTDPGRDARVPTPPAEAGPTGPLQRIDLGSVGPDAPVTFTVPAGALGFNVTVHDASGGSPTGVGVRSLVGPSGQRAFDAFIPKGGSFETSVGYTWAAASVPQPDVAPEPGTWTARFGRLSPSTAPLRAEVTIQTTPDGAFHGGALDLDVWVPDGLRVWLDGGGTATISAGSAPTHPWVVARVDAFYALLGDLVGLDRGDVRFHALPARFRALGEDSLAQAAEATAPRADAQTLHLVLTEDLFDGQAAGTTTAIPGAAARGGSPVSAIASITQDEGPENQASTWLHEGGHFLGLNHTTELDNYGEDPLPDTPRCPDTGLDFERLGRCPDRANVMFPLGPWPGDVPALSPKQLVVYRGSPIYRAYPTGTPRATRVVRRALPPRAPGRSGLPAHVCRFVPPALGLPARR